MSPKNAHPPHITVRDLTMAYGDFVVMRNLTFSIRRGEIFVIMGGSGCGKSTLLRHLTGLLQPRAGKIYYEGVDFTSAEEGQRNQMLHKFGVMFQGGALWSSMTLAENVAFPLEEFTDLPPEIIRETVELKLALVGLARVRGFLPGPDFGRHVQACQPGPRRWRWIRKFYFLTSLQPAWTR